MRRTRSSWPWLLLTLWLLCPTPATWSESSTTVLSECEQALVEADQALANADARLQTLEAELQRRSDESAKLAAETAKAAVKEATIPLLARIAGLEASVGEYKGGLDRLSKQLRASSVRSVVIAVLCAIGGGLLGWTVAQAVP